MFGIVLRDREHVGVQRAAEGGGEQRRPDEPAEPRHDGAGGHHRAGGEDLLVVGRRSRLASPPGLARAARVAAPHPADQADGDRAEQQGDRRCRGTARSRC